MAFTALFNSTCLLVLAYLFQTSKIVSASCDASCCPSGMVQGSYSCRKSCGDPIGMTDCREICEETYVRKLCYVPEEDSFILNGTTYVNLNCSQRCTCNDGHLNCDSNYQCHSDAACRVENNVRQCYCNTGYDGDGVTSCTPRLVPTDCNDVQNAGKKKSGVYSILPAEYGSPFDVYCNMNIDGGGWTVFQRRSLNETTREQPPDISKFYRSWDEYKEGFGDLLYEFWLGNEKLHYLTRQTKYEYRADYVLQSGSTKSHTYSGFRIDNELNKYKVNVLGIQSGSGNSLNNTQNIAFSTYDRDNDGKSSTNCAAGHRSGWWHGGYYSDNSYSYCYKFPDPKGNRYRTCSYANPNGEFYSGNGKNIFDHNDCHIKYTELKIRRPS